MWTEEDGDSSQENSKLKRYPFTQVPKMNLDGVLENEKANWHASQQSEKQNFSENASKNIRKEKELNGKLVTNIWKAC